MNKQVLGIGELTHQPELLMLEQKTSNTYLMVFFLLLLIEPSTDLTNKEFALKVILKIIPGHYKTS